ncbi:MAG: hypothetical protein ABIR79_18315 [Candidatus Binatia bacterium]
MSAEQPSKTGTAILLATFLVVGLGARGALVEVAPRYGFTGDHIDYVCWGRQTRAAGVLSLYTRGPGECPADVPIDGQIRRLATGTGERLNYPPLAAYVFAAQGWLLERLDPGAIANTVTSRAVYAVSTTVAELIVAAGVFTLVGTFATPAMAALAFGATWLAPPLLLDGPFWGQTESWVLAPAVWMIVAMTRARWVTAGVIFGVALALKPSALLFGPLWLYAFLFKPVRVRLVLSGLVALAVLNAIALPFWLDSGATWLRVTYLDNFVYRLQWTTAMTFNVWYVDLLTTGILDPRVPVLGLSRDTWGGIFLISGLIVSFALTRRWEHRDPARAALGMVPLAALVTLAAVMLPTRVHSTYGAFTTPFLIATAFLIPRATLGVVACVVTMSLQILSWQWGTLLAMHATEESQFPPATRARRQVMRDSDRPREWALTLANLAAAAAAAGGIAVARVRRDAARPDA